MESISTDSEFESSSSELESESSSNEYSVEETLVNTYLPLQSIPTVAKPEMTQQSKDDLVKSRLLQMHPLIQKTKLDCDNVQHHHKKKESAQQEPVQRMKQVLPPLISAITKEPYKPLSGKPNTSSEKSSELDEQLLKRLKERFVGHDTSPKTSSGLAGQMPDLLKISTLSLDCPPMSDKKDKKDKKGKKDKRFTMSEMKPHFAERMATEMMFHDGIQNSTIQSLMMHGEFTSTPMGCIGAEKEGPCQGVTILAHIRQYHNEFYRLLYTQNLLEVIESRKDLAILIPSARLLVTLDITSEATRTALLYHLVIIPRGEFFQTVEGMLQYETLSGDYIQVESDSGLHYINGVLAKPDVNCIYHIYHVSQILSRDNIVSIASGGEDASSGEEPVDGEEPTADEAMGTETLFISTKLNAVTNTLTKSPTALGFLAEKMNGQFYTASHEMKDHVLPTKEGESANIHLSIYNTTPLYSEYNENKMLDISRIKPETVLTLNCSGDSLTRLEKGDLKMTEYGCQGPEKAMVKKSDLARGLVGLSFQLDGTPGFIVLMCKMQAQDGNCFVSEDKHLLMRFSENKLESIALNQAQLLEKTKSISTSPLDEHHFFEYRLSPDLYKSHVTRAEFDSMLLTQGKIKRWFKKKTQQTTDKAKCGYKRLQSIDLRPIPMGYLKKLVDQVNEKTGSAASQSSFVTLNAFDKSCRVLSSKSVLAKRFDVTTEKGDKVVVYQFNSSQETQSSMEGDYHMLEIQMDASPKLTIHTHTINRKGNDYFTARRHANVYLFAFDPLNGRLRSLYIVVAKSHIGKKILEYRL